MGKGPSSVAVDPTTGRAYVANRQADTVSVLDRQSHKVLATVRTGHEPSEVAVDSVNKRAYVTNLDGTLSVIDQSNKVVATVRLLQYPTSLTTDSTTGRVYVAAIPNALPTWLRDGPTQEPPPSTGVLVIDANTNVVATTIPLRNAGSLALDASTHRLYVAVSDAIAAIDLKTHHVVARKAISTHAGLLRGIAVNPNTHLVYAAHNFAWVQVLHGARLDAVADLRVGGQIADLAIDPRSNRVYVSNPGLPKHPVNDVSVIDGTTNQVLRSLAVGKDPWGMAIDPVAHLLYVANHGSNTVSIIAV
ncbi:MAG: YncE family protein [Chloroflexota bacterium]